MSAFRRIVRLAGSNCCHVGSGETGLRSGSAWHLIDGSQQCNNWKPKFLFSQDLASRGFSPAGFACGGNHSLLLSLPGSGHHSQYSSYLPNRGRFPSSSDLGLSPARPGSCRATLGKSLSLSRPQCPHLYSGGDRCCKRLRTLSECPDTKLLYVYGRLVVGGRGSFKPERWL